MDQPLTAPPAQEPAKEHGQGHDQIESEDPEWIANQGSQQGTEENAVVETGESYGGYVGNSTARDV